MIDDKPSIAELQQNSECAAEGCCCGAADRIIAASPALLEIAAAALAYDNAQCDSPHCDHPAHRGGCAILKAGRRLCEALAKVRP